MKMFKFVWFNEGIFWNFNIVKFNIVNNCFFYWLFKNSNFMISFNSSFSSLLELEDVWSKRGENNMFFDIFDNFYNRLFNNFFGISEGWNFSICWVW